MPSPSDIPKVDPTDSDDTRWALETAKTLWDRGDPREALRWVRRATEAAAESGRDARAVVLARAASELRARLDIPNTVPPPPPPGGDGQAVIPKAAPAPEAETAPVSHPPASSPRASQGPAPSLPVNVLLESPPAGTDLGGVVAERAIRVAVRMPAGSSTYLARPLQAGELVKQGETVALLVTLDPRPPGTP